MKGKGTNKECNVCKKEFYVYPYAIKTRKYCSDKCKGIAYRKNHPMKGKYKKSKIISCLFCKKEVRVNLKSDRKYCSRVCYNKGGKTKLNVEAMQNTIKKTNNKIDEISKFLKRKNVRVINVDRAPRPDLILIDFDSKEVVAYELETSKNEYLKRKIYPYRKQFIKNGLIYDQVVVQSKDERKIVWQNFPAKNLEC